MPRTIAGTEAPTLGDLKTSEGRKKATSLASAAFVVTAIGTPVVVAGVAAGLWIKERIAGATSGLSDLFRGI